MLSKEFLEDEYHNKGKSWPQIARENNTYPNKIRRLADSYGITSRSFSEAQKIVLTQREHPTKGKPRSNQTKEKTSKSLKETWDFMSKEERERRADKARENFNKRSDKEDFWRKAGDAVRQSAVEGSKLEKMVVLHLRSQGKNVIFHGKAETNANLEVDILLPADGVAIEIDGPSHFLPIWGDDALRLVMVKDAEKNGLLLNSYRVLRLRYAKWSKAICKKALQVVDDFIKSDQKFSIREVS